MATSVTDFSSLQPSDYQSTVYSVQDYALAPVGDSLNSPSLDSPLGLDTFGVPLASYVNPSLTTQPTDASAGLNANDPTLLPYQNPNQNVLATVDPNWLENLGRSVISGAVTPSSGSTFSLDANLPLVTPNASIMTPIYTPKPVATAMGASLWQDMLGIVSPILGSAKTGVAGTTKSVPGIIKPAPKTAIANPISGTTTALVIGITASLIGIVLWSFAGSK